MGKPIRVIRKRIRKKPYFLFYAYLLAALLLLASVASYTWFTLSRAPQVNNMNVYITSGTGLQLAATPDAEEWTLQLDLFGNEEHSLQQVTWSAESNRFKVPKYAFDGRTLRVIAWEPLEEDPEAPENMPYVKKTFYARCDMPADVTLSMPRSVDTEGTIQGGGTYVVGDSQGRYGLETAIRIGLRMTCVDSTGKALSDPGELFVYEPNVDRHVDGSTGETPTYSVDRLDGTTPLVEEQYLIKQTISPSAKNPGEFLQNPVLFNLKPTDIVKIEFYMWLEGQDVDCSNAMGMSKDVTTSVIEANLQFFGTTDSQSGMGHIPE